MLAFTLIPGHLGNVGSNYHLPPLPWHWPPQANPALLGVEILSEQWEPFTDPVS